MTKTHLVCGVLAVASALTACKKESSCSDESRAAIGKARTAVSGMTFDGDDLETLQDTISELQYDLDVSGALRQSVELMLEEIASARETIDEHPDFAEDGDLSGLDELAAAQESLESQQKDVLKQLDDAEEHCAPR